VAFLSLASIIALIFLGSQVSTILSTVGEQAILGGTVEFAAGAQDDCFVEGPATSFASSESIFVAAHFERQVEAGEPVTVVVTYPDGSSESSEVTYDDAGACVTDTIPPGLETGQWTIQFRSGSEVLSTGTFEITP
jgi:hypothetical protein